MDAAAFAELRAKLLEAAGEAASFARQQREDAERLKKGGGAGGPAQGPVVPAVSALEEGMAGEEGAGAGAGVKRHRGEDAAMDGAVVLKYVSPH